MQYMNSLTYLTSETFSVIPSELIIDLRRMLSMDETSRPSATEFTGKELCPVIIRLICHHWYNLHWIYVDLIFQRNFLLVCQGCPRMNVTAFPDQLTQLFNNLLLFLSTKKDLSKVFYRNEIIFESLVFTHFPSITFLCAMSSFVGTDYSSNDWNSNFLFN